MKHRTSPLLANRARRDFLRTGALALSGLASAPLYPLAPIEGVTFDARSVIVDGTRQLLLCGEMHYTRSTPEMWPTLLDRSKALGINCIATYVFWSKHEPRRDHFDFTGDRDLPHFLDLCRERGLYVFLRVGPYCCAEWNFGGFPSWLRDEPNIVTRTMNQPYLDRVEKYFRALALEVKPHLVPNGGPVALIQVENEYANVAKRYGAAGQEYLRWIIELATRVGFAAVPTTTCEGGASGAIETGNGDTFPAEKVARFRAAHPHAPLLWSENYPGWYEIWGGRPHTPRDPREMAFDTLDFVSNGGSGFNYYMWHGGTNFGRTAMYLQATTYDFHAPLDEYGRPTLMGQYLGVMHRALAAHAALIVAGKRTQTTDSSGRIRTVWASESQTLVLFADPAAKTARLTSGERTLFDTHAELQKQTAAFHAPAWLPFGRPATIEWAAEPFPSKRVDPALESADPIEQLSLTHDSSDYLWYTTDITVAQPSNTLLIPYGADMFYVFLDGKLAATSALPLNENRGPILPIDPAHPPIIANHHELEVGGFRHEFTLTASPGRHRLEILSVAVGMIKGDWQIANSMEQERKGIWLGVQLNGQRLTGWRMHPGLAGEGSPVAYAPLGTLTQRLNWFRVSMPVESAGLTENADFRLDAQGLGKGFAVLNGHAVGRYWLIERQGQTGEPTQRFYHIPRSWLRPANELILFEETEAVPTRISLERRHYPSA